MITTFNQKPRWRPGNYRVMRWCCISGMCLECRASGDTSKRKRVEQTRNVSKTWAEHVVRGWSLYEATIEKV
jgi:hypothetical protein